MKTVTGLNRLIEYRELAVSQMVQAFAMAALSPARRRKTGAVIIKQIEGKEWVPLSQGYNGTRTGDSNLCEDIYGKTLPNVIHAEKNTFIKMITQGIATQGSTLVVTFIPCANCVQDIIDARVAEVIYCQTSERKAGGLKELSKAGVHVSRISEKEVSEFTASINKGLEQDKFMAEVTDSNPIKDWLDRNPGIEPMDVVRRFMDNIAPRESFQTLQVFSILPILGAHKDSEGTLSLKGFEDWMNLTFIEYNKYLHYSKHSSISPENFIKLFEEKK